MSLREYFQDGRRRRWVKHYSEYDEKPVISPSAAYREAIVAFLLDRDGNKCSVCLKPFMTGVKWTDGISIDHVVPLALGGLNRLENLQLLHFRCNVKKGSKKVAG